MRLSLPAHARREVTVGVLPFRPSERVEVEAGQRRLTIDLRVAAGPLLAAEAGLLEIAKRERGAGVVAVGEEDSALWEGFDEVLVSRETAMRRWELRIDVDRVWVRPIDRPWGVVWEPTEGPRRGIPSIQGAWTGRLTPSAWGPDARRRFLVTMAAIVLALAAGMILTRGRGPGTRWAVLVIVVLASTIGAANGPEPRPAVSAMSVIGPLPGGGWQGRGIACASRGSDGDVILELPGVPRPVFADLNEAQEGRWGIVWGERAKLVFPARVAGQACWFEWQANVDLTGRIVAMRDGGAANETGEALSPALLLIGGIATLRGSLGPGESVSPGTTEPLPPPFTPALLASLDAGWRRGRILLGRLQVGPPGLGDVDVVEGQTWLWAPLD